MNLLQIKSIDDVISELDSIIYETELKNDPLGYFAILYRKVTLKVKEGIATGYFEDGPRMEKLDVIFAKRYVDAYRAWKKNSPVTLSWEKAFSITQNKNILVFQHLLLGMNAHINLDLGIAAAEISTKDNIHHLKKDFIKINEILSSLVAEVQYSLSTIWPFLKKILAKTGELDDYLVDFSMKVARDGAWNFATHIINFRVDVWPELSDDRDTRVSEKTRLITEPNKWIQFLFWIIRLGERGTVSEKMNKLKTYKLSSFPHDNPVSAQLLK